MGIRIAIGTCNCTSGLQSNNPRIREMCRRVVSRIDALRTILTADAVSIPACETAKERIDGDLVVLTTFRTSLPGGEVLAVVQGFLPSWRFPKYFGPMGIGHVVADGIVVGVGGKIREADDEALWEFR